MKIWTINCEECGKTRNYSIYDSYYEANRLGKTLCKSCANRKRWANTPIRSKYDKFIKRGDVFGLLTVVSDRVETGCRVRCKCACGKIITRRVQRVLGGKFLGCKECLVENLSLNWKGIGKVPKMAFIKIKNRAEKKHKMFDLTLEYISKLFDDQHEKCALSGMGLTFYINGKPRQNASLDRIDSSKGYIKGNVQWVHKDINFMKQGYSDEYFVTMCRKVAEQHNK